MIGKIMILSAFVVLGFVDCCLMVSASRYDRKQTEKTGGFYCEQKEIAEIKKQYKPEYSCIGKIAGCYVDKDKNKVLSFNISPFELPEEELEKYFDILKSS